jgi:glutathione synthase/RimK-type ligase-like ATP-grasp enzyme
MRGVLETAFRGVWISDPAATERASNKILQLNAADRAGFRIPATLVSQSPSVVRQFFVQYGPVIYKPVAGARGPLLFTRFLTEELILEEASLMTCPTIYQEYIPGDLHIRLNCFGTRSFASTIESSELDWRPNLNVPIQPYDVPETLNVLVRRTLDLLGLEMGVFDIKLTPEGEFVFLEVNPQGQFLFLEGATGQPLGRYMAEYLLEKAA